MIALIFLIFAAPMLLGTLASLCMTRTIPLAAGLAAACVAAASDAHWMTSIGVGFGAVTVTTFLLERFIEWHATRSVIVALEVTAASIFAVTAAFAVLHGLGVEGVWLWASCAICSALGASAALMHRTEA